MTKNLKLIDLFSGCGGLSYGFSKAGFKVVLGVDSWDLSLKSFKRNHPDANTVTADLSEISLSDIYKNIHEDLSVDTVVVGGPPCQGFSISGKRRADDPRNKLYKSFIKNIKYLKPTAFVMENVPNILSIAGGKFREEIINDYKKLGYTVTYKILLASDYGIPQNRKRVFFVGLNNGKRFEFPQTTHGEGLNHKVTTKEALSDLPEYDLRDGSKYPTPAESPYQKDMRHNSIGVFNHEAIVHTERTRSIIAMVPDGGNYKSLPPELQRTRKVNIAWTRFASNKPSYTIDTGHNHHFHYRYNRVPTARESARLQSFPDSFVFSGKKNEQIKQIGNAVPPLIAYVIATELKKYL